MFWTSDLRRSRWLAPPVWCLLGALTAAAPLVPREIDEESESALKAEIKKVTDVAMRSLRFGQDADGSWDQSVVGTALATRAFRHSPRRYSSEDGPFVAAALSYLAAPSPAVEAPLLDSALTLLTLAETASPDYRRVVDELETRVVAVLTANGGATRPGGSRPAREVMLALAALRAAGLSASHPLWARSVAWAEECVVAGTEPSRLRRAREDRSGAENGVTSCGVQGPADRFALAGIGAGGETKAASRWPKVLLSEVAAWHESAAETGVDSRPAPAFEGFFAAAALAAWTRAGAYDEAVRRRWREQLVSTLKQGQVFEGHWRSTSRDWPRSDPDLATSFAILALSIVDDS